MKGNITGDWQEVVLSVVVQCMKINVTDNDDQEGWSTVHII